MKQDLRLTETNISVKLNFSLYKRRCSFQLALEVFGCLIEPNYIRRHFILDLISHSTRTLKKSDTFHDINWMIQLNKQHSLPKWSNVNLKQVMVSIREYSSCFEILQSSLLSDCPNAVGNVTCKTVASKSKT